MGEKKGSSVEFPEFVISEDTGLLGTVESVHADQGRFSVEWSDGLVTAERLDAEGNYWRRCLSRTQAEACLKIVQQYVDQKYGEGWEPKLYAPGHEGPYWNISLEGADEWALRIGGYDETQFPSGVFAEPVYPWCLGLYPAS